MLYQVDSKELKKLIDEKKVVLIDVRELHEYQEAHFGCATLIQLGVIDVSKLPKHDDKKLVIHCRSGKRSTAACEKLLSQDPSLEVYNLTGGILAWQNESFSEGYLVKPPKIEEEKKEEYRSSFSLR